MEPFAFEIAQNVLIKLASHTYQEVFLAWGVQVELNKLKETLSDITSVLLDAEEKQSKSHLLTNWLAKLKDVCNDIDEVVDTFEYKELHIQALISGGTKGKVRSFFSRSKSVGFRIIMGRRIKDIRLRLDEIAAAKAQFGLTERIEDWRSMDMESRETHSFVHEPDVIGRHVDKEQIISHLWMDCDQGDGNVSVITINGLGGLGKTTLAKLVYNDYRVAKKFKLRMWVCVSDDFDNRRLVREIITAATNKNPENLSMEQMQIKIRDVLSDKVFLLFLDDVWDSESSGVTLTKWNALKTLLDVGANGSKVIVTTRNESVACLMGSIYMHQLQGLPHLDCLSVFIKVAFRNGEERNFPDLMKIGDDIVKKCGGVPLAVLTLGGLLHSTRDQQYWLHVRDNGIWNLKQEKNDIIPALKLSYDALPYYLKRCFSLCSLFPKDYNFRSEKVVAMWMANGLLQHSSGNQDFEEIGLQYIKQLSSRSLFQVDEYDEAFLVHDLVHDLAVSVGQEDCSSVNFRPPDSGRVRHLSISQQALDEKEGGNPQILLQLEKLRTIILISGLNSQSLVERCISRFKNLRMLDLSHSTLEVLPSSIGNLIHLRYLDLSHNPYIRRLPDSIWKLHNLQTLLLVLCKNLEELPKDMGNWISLRYLKLTVKQIYFSEEAIGSLINLQSLTLVQCRNLRSLGEGTRSLVNLRKLVIDNCESLESLPHNVSALEHLWIWNCPNLNWMISGEGICGLRLLTIGYSESQDLPVWLLQSANTLQELWLTGWNNLRVLPKWFQNFSMLKQLTISQCPQLSTFPERMDRLTALRKLVINGSDLLYRSLYKEHGSMIAHIREVVYRRTKWTGSQKRLQHNAWEESEIIERRKKEAENPWLYYT